MEDASRLSVSWKRMAITSTVVTIAALATLVTVVAIEDNALLASVALMLAILAFVAQLLIFIAQGITANEQSSQSLRINSETQSLLVDIRARTQGAQSMLRDQVNTLLDHVLKSDGSDKRLPAVSTSGSDMSGSTDFGARMDAKPWLHDERWQVMHTYPSASDAAALYKELSGLTPQALASLTKYGNDCRLSLILGEEPGLSLAEHHPFSDELERAGLVSIVANRGQLTDRGLRAVALLFGDGAAPDHILQENERYGVFLRQ